MTSRHWIVGLAAVAGAGLYAGAAAAGPSCNAPQVIHLAGLRHGGGNAVVERRDRIGVDGVACYRINIRGGSRTLNVHLFSADRAGFLRLYAPDWNTRRVGDTFAFTGTALPGAGDADKATHWKGPAPLGNVLIVVGMTGAARQYRLRIEAY